jgi:hypothetical protein
MPRGGDCRFIGPVSVNFQTAAFYFLPKLQQRRKQKNNRDMFSRFSPVEVEGKAERPRSAITFDNPIEPNAREAEIFSLCGDRVSILPALRLTMRLFAMFVARCAEPGRRRRRINQTAALHFFLQLWKAYS